MRHYILLLIIMLNPLSSFAKGQYQIDLIIFAKPSSGTNISALMINTPIPPLTQNALKLTSDTAKTGKSYELLSPAKSSLRDALYQLNRNHQYTILGHYSWIQPATNKTSIALPLTTHDGWQMQGTMTITDGVFYSFNSTLQISPPSSPEAFFLVTQNQRLKADTMYYFDHPQIEMLVKIHQVA